LTPALTHVALHVDDFAGSVAFYERYCGMRECHRREDHDLGVVWLAEPGRENEFIIVLIGGGRDTAQAEDDFGHLGFAVESRAEVDRLAALAEKEGRLVWPPRQEPYPVGYYCGVRDPGGRCVEFSYGQPLGPGAEAAQ
jgi:catechol 2,3-dioxygenase-like lactoylglutathione lyase family enzyme